MADQTSPLRFRLLNEFQRNFPLVQRPFLQIASAVSATEGTVISVLQLLKAEGAISRVGATVRPNTVGVSTLAAISVPADRLDRAAAFISAWPGVNHVYVRENPVNLWFVVTAPDEATLVHAIAAISQATDLPVFDLRLVRAFHIDLGFNMTDGSKTLPAHAADMSVLQEDDGPLLQALVDGLPIIPQPYREIAGTLQRREEQVLERIAALSAAGIISRFGVIVRHRQLGWAANAMVVWNVPLDQVIAAGEALARLPGVSLCYQRQTVPALWPFPLYCMVHARSREETLSVVANARALPPLQDVDHSVLFSSYCFKQTGAWLHQQKASA